MHGFPAVMPACAEHDGWDEMTPTQTGCGARSAPSGASYRLGAPPSVRRGAASGFDAFSAGGSSASGTS